jgi:hypothetical protein
MSEWLRDLDFIVWLGDLWKKVLDEEMPKFVEANDAGGSFVYRIETELFPLDTRAMDCDYNNGCNAHEIFGWYIPIYGYGLAWEVEEFIDQPAWAKPVIAAVAMLCGISDAAGDMYHLYLIENNVDLDTIDETLGWITDYRRAVDLLSSLDSPLDALATVYKITTKGSGNPFLDTVDLFWRYEFANCGDYCWCEACISRLAKKWQEVEGEISHLQQYKNAFGASITTDMVIDAMINLEKSG